MRRERGSIARAIACGGRPTDGWSISGAPMPKSKSVGSASNSGKSRWHCRRTRAWPRRVTAVWNGDGRDRLIGYVVPDRGASVDPRDVLAHAGKRLPSYMVPAAVVVLDAVPLTVHGKLDRAALPTPDFSSAATPDRPPRTETENLLAALFAQVLGLDSVGVHDSFFELGGDSIMSIQLVARARDAGVIISPRDVFDHKSVAALAESGAP